MKILGSRRPRKFRLERHRYHHREIYFGPDNVEHRSHRLHTLVILLILLLALWWYLGG